MWRKAAQFDPVSAGASAWIYTIARNLRIDPVRRAARTGTVDHDAELDYLVDPAEPADDVMARNDEADRIARALSSLSEEQSMAIRLSFIEERPHPEIADYPRDTAGDSEIQDQIGDEPAESPVGRNEMSVTHHPPPELLAGFAAGTLDAGEHLAIAVHVSGCSTCRRLMRAVEGIGGSTLEAIEPAPMKAGAFEAVMAKLDRSPPQPSAPADQLRG